MAALIDLTGQRFGQLTVIERAGACCGSAAWRCRCDCGNETVVSRANLQNKPGKAVRSCGHRRVELARALKLRHGEAARGSDNETAEYRTWMGMRARCENSNRKTWRNYGGRGVRVCNEWRGSFETFLAHVGRRPTPRHSLDRWPNNEGAYEPGNVRWATKSEQRRNQRTMDGANG